MMKSLALYCLPLASRVHDYRDAFKILREQGCSLINKKFYYDDTHKISTGLESVNQQNLTLMAYVSIG
ncbi:hypothetical protein NX85_22805, partial [Aeromonas salmonicida subsp. salmonicida]|uniref:hypothetical protein n=1 Tax=Aeromonas salmonicida TaxID=645 RepID=UPI0005445002